MFEIPSDLPLKLSSLAWLLGGWQGWGTIAAPHSKPSAVKEGVPAETPSGLESPGSQDDSEADGKQESRFVPVLQDLRAEICGEQMKLSTRIFEGVLAGEFDPTWSAKEGLDRIVAGELISEETSYWSVDTPLAVVPAGPDEPRELRVVSAGLRGFAVLWAGVAVGPRIQLTSDSVARAPRADDLAHFSRMYGLVGGELMWASDSMVPAGEYSTEITGRLLRTGLGSAPEEEQDR